MSVHVWAYLATIVKPWERVQLTVGVSEVPLGHGKSCLGSVNHCINGAERTLASK